MKSEVTKLCIRGSRSHNQCTVNTRELNLGLVNYESQCFKEIAKTLKFKC